MEMNNELFEKALIFALQMDVKVSHHRGYQIR